MGRQAYITRLALGRSPYEAPVLSDTGGFILGPYAHEFDNTDGYTQQYNERGHPEFRASRAAARELRRAKNDVLSTVGVVYKKAEPTRPKKNDGKLVKMVQSENEVGFLLSSLDNLVMYCSIWWLICLRMRVQAFESYSLPLIQIMKSELGTLGMTRFLFAGLPVCLVSATLSSWRKYWMSERLKEWLEGFGNQWIFDSVFWFVYASIESFGALQGLHLIFPGQAINFRSLIYSLCHSSIPSNIFFIFGSPIVLLSVYTPLNQGLQAIMWYVMRSNITKPDKPDRISYLALEGTEDAETKVPGLRDRPYTLRDEVDFQYTKLRVWFEDIFERFFGSHQPTDESSHLDTNHTTTSAAQPDEPDSELASTATPDPEDLFDTHYISQQPDTEPAETDRPPHPFSRANTLVTPLNQSPATTPPASPRVRASLIHRDSETVTMQLELLESEREIEINHSEDLPNQSLYDEYASTISLESDNASQHPQHNHFFDGEGEAEASTVPTAADANVDTELSPLAQAIRDGTTNHHHQSTQTRQKPNPHHRVTALSNFPSDALASHLACLLATAALLPLEAVFVRSLARSFLGDSPSPAVRPVFRWQGWRHHATLLTILGMQGLVSSVVWGVGTAVAVGIGRLKYQWGKL